MVYVDANVLISAAISNAEAGERARTFLTNAFTRKEPVVTSALTLDEVAWEVKKAKGAIKAVQICENYLTTPLLQFADVTPELMKIAMQIMRQFNLDPRDSVHAATCLTLKIGVIASEDADFDRLEKINIRRIGLKAGD